MLIQDLSIAEQDPKCGVLEGAAAEAATAAGQGERSQEETLACRLVTLAFGRGIQEYQREESGACLVEHWMTGICRFDHHFVGHHRDGHLGLHDDGDRHLHRDPDSTSVHCCHPYQSACDD
jgi:hypothetical protein